VVMDNFCRRVNVYLKFKVVNRHGFGSLNKSSPVEQESFYKLMDIQIIQ
jgi:hypothetical protein